MSTPALAPPPGSQGPGPMPARLIQALDLALVRRAASMVPGDHRSPGVGTGTELAQLREYQPGDDVRQLDAAASARTGTPHVRLQIPERLMTSWIVLDVSPSMAFGTGARLKSDVAAGVAIVLARLSVRRGGRAGLLLCGGATEIVLPPRGGRRASAAIERAVRVGVVPDGGGDADSHARALARVRRRARAPGRAGGVADFRSEGWEGSLRALGYRHSLLAVDIRDPREEALPEVGTLRLVDPESGAEIEADTRDEGLRRRYAERERARQESVRDALRAASADQLVLGTDTDWLEELGRRLR